MIRTQHFVTKREQKVQDLSDFDEGILERAGSDTPSRHETSLAPLRHDRKDLGKRFCMTIFVCEKHLTRAGALK